MFKPVLSYYIIREGQMYGNKKACIKQALK